MTWARELFNQPVTIELGWLPDDDVLGWLESQAQSGYLLAHADDGVIWGRLENGAFVTSTKVMPKQHAEIAPPLRVETLQQARLFDENWEIFLWRDRQGWRFRRIVDGDDPNANQRWAFDESNILWGTGSEVLANQFTLLTDGAQGLRHAVPKSAQLSAKGERVSLRVRNYLAEMDNGVNYIALSRLVKIEVKPYG